MKQGLVNDPLNKTWAPITLSALFFISKIIFSLCAKTQQNLNNVWHTFYHFEVVQVIDINSICMTCRSLPHFRLKLTNQLSCRYVTLLSLEVGWRYYYVKKIESSVMQNSVCNFETPYQYFISHYRSEESSKKKVDCSSHEMETTNPLHHAGYRISRACTILVDWCADMH